MSDDRSSEKKTHEEPSKGNNDYIHERDYVCKLPPIPPLSGSEKVMTDKYGRPFNSFPYDERDGRMGLG